MATIFSKIVAGEIPSYKVAEDDRYYAFLDINPMAKGHTLVIPKHEVNYMFDLDEDEYAGLWAFARKVAMALEQAVPCKRIGIGVLGLEVPHCHIRLRRPEADSASRGDAGNRRRHRREAVNHKPQESQALVPSGTGALNIKS